MRNMPLIDPARACLHAEAFVRRATLADVARHVGVTTSAISNALRRAGRIS